MYGTYFHHILTEKIAPSIDPFFGPVEMDQTSSSNQRKDIGIRLHKEAANIIVELLVSLLMGSC